jgi:membrane-associated protease RseP (regulator of RpoE activity)
MSVLYGTLGVLFFVVGVAASIGLHELGHLVPGKLFDVKVTQYFVGFGRTLWSRRRGETEYGVKAVPFGGYVKLVGMVPPGPDQDPGTVHSVRSGGTGVFGQLISDTRRAEYDLVEPGDEDRLFYRLAWWKKITVMASGVMTNLVIAFLLFAAVFVGHGVLTPQMDDTTIGSVSRCVIATTSSHQARDCTAKDPEAPAKAAGIHPGDRIVSFNGTPVADWQQLQRLIRANRDGSAEIVVSRDGTDKTLRTTTTVTARPDLHHAGKVTRTGFLGVSPTERLERKDLGFVASTMATGTWSTIKTLGTFPVKLYHVGRAALGLEQRDPNGPMSIVGAGRIAGEVTANAPLVDGFFSVLTLLAGLNLFLAIFNLVPLPPLDGGPIAASLYEAGRRGVARLRRRPDPGYVDSAKMLPVTYVVAALILLMSVVLVYADIVAPVSLS